jgi:hypothetical protein
MFLQKKKEHVHHSSPIGSVDDIFNFVYGNAIVLLVLSVCIMYATGANHAVLELGNFACL